MVQGFTGSTEVDLPVACTYDFEVSATQVPARAARRRRCRSRLLFSGTVFTRGATGFAVEQLSVVARGPLPACRWRPGAR